MLSLTEHAQTVVNGFIKTSEETVAGLRISATGGGCSGMQYAIALETATRNEDTVIECGTIKIIIDPQSLPLLQGVTMDFIDSLDESGFKFINSNTASNCSGCSSFSG